jgi:cyanophycinase
VGEKTRGKLVIIGGAENKQENCDILEKIVELAGGTNGNLAILTIAANNYEEIGEEYVRIFGRLGMNNVNVVHISSRKDAEHGKYKSAIEQASCIFFTGGDQLRITSLMCGTTMEKMLQKTFEKGVVIAGTSAGASVMSQTMITSGNDDDSPKKCTLKMAPGLGLLSGVVVDQHFAQRGRIGRLLVAIAQNPRILGIGIDEDTAILVNSDAVFEVVGSHAVTVLDAENLTFTNVSELKPDDILALGNVVMHVLPAGYKYDLNLRRPII